MPPSKSKCGNRYRLHQLLLRGRGARVGDYQRRQQRNNNNNRGRGGMMIRGRGGRVDKRGGMRARVVTVSVLVPPPPPPPAPPTASGRQIRRGRGGQQSRQSRGGGGGRGQEERSRIVNDLRRLMGTDQFHSRAQALLASHRRRLPPPSKRPPPPPPPDPRLKYEDKSICSMTHFPLTRLGPVSAEMDKSYQYLIGNFERAILTRGRRAIAWDQIAKMAWNHTFTKVLTPGLTSFQFILGMVDATIFNMMYDRGCRRRHVILYQVDDCKELMRISMQIGHRSIRSIAFVECDFGKCEDARAALFYWFSMKDLRAISFSRCQLPEKASDRFFQDIVTICTNISRVEVETSCRDENYNFVKCFRFLNMASSISQRHICLCGSENVESGGEEGCVIEDPPVLRTLSDLVSPMVAVLMCSRGRTNLEEVEFDMNELSSTVESTELGIAFDALKEADKLSVITLNCKKFTPEAQRLHRDWIQSMKGKKLTTVEVKGGDYFISNADEKEETGKVGILEMLETLKSRTDTHPLRRLVISDAVPKRFEKLYLKSDLNKLHPLESLKIENCEFFDVQEATSSFFTGTGGRRPCYSYRPKKFPTLCKIYVEPLTSLSLRGAVDLDWRIFENLVRALPHLRVLDISRVGLQFEPFYSHPDRHQIVKPLLHIFKDLPKLEVLLMDDLDIDDESLFYGLDKETAGKWLKPASGGPPQIDKSLTTLASLQKLERLSLQNTRITNISVACMAAYLPKLVFLNVSYTHVNIHGIDYARSRNCYLEFHAEGCYINYKQQSKYRSPVWNLPKVKTFHPAFDNGRTGPRVRNTMTDGLLQSSYRRGQQDLRATQPLRPPPPPPSTKTKLTPPTNPEFNTNKPPPRPLLFQTMRKGGPRPRNKNKPILPSSQVVPIPILPIPIPSQVVPIPILPSSISIEAFSDALVTIHKAVCGDDLEDERLLTDARNSLDSVKTISNNDENKAEPGPLSLTPTVFNFNDSRIKLFDLIPSPCGNRSRDKTSPATLLEQYLVNNGIKCSSNDSLAAENNNSDGEPLPMASNEVTIYNFNEEVLPSIDLNNEMDVDVGGESFNPNPMVSGRSRRLSSVNMAGVEVELDDVSDDDDDESAFEI